jgi:hypothetical protein
MTVSTPPGGEARRIVWEQQVGTLEFLLHRPPPRADLAMVLVTKKGERWVIHPSSQPTWRELMRQRIRMLYRVDLGEHHALIEGDLPSYGDALPFHAEADLHWRVADPARMVDRRLHTTAHVVRAIRPRLLARMRYVSRDFTVEQTAQAEGRLNDVLSLDGLGGELGIETSWFVRLTLEDAVRTHAARQLAVRHELEFERDMHDLRTLKEGNDELLLSARVERYREIILTGDVNQFALRIAQNPSEATQVLEALRNDRHMNQRNTVDFFTRLAESGLIERHEISDKVQETANWLSESIDRVLESGRSMAVEREALPRQRTPRSVDIPPPPSTKVHMPNGAEPPAEQDG